MTDEQREGTCINRATFEDAGVDSRGVDVYRCVRCLALVPACDMVHNEYESKVRKADVRPHQPKEGSDG